MWLAVNRFSNRVTSFDKTMFLTHDVPNVVTRHFHDIRCANRRYKNCKALPVSLVYLLCGFLCTPGTLVTCSCYMRMTSLPGLLQNCA